jgi:FkbM family methyltransferase
MSYYYFLKEIDSKKINTIFELGSCNLMDGIKLIKIFSNAKCYSFECNPDCLSECKTSYSKLSESQKSRLCLIEKAVCLEDGKIKFYPFDLEKYNNMGASSLLEIDFSTRNKDDPDYNIPNPQKEIIVEGTRLDSFIGQNQITNVDLLCIDLQGYELNAIKSLGDHLNNVKYIITECSIKSTYKQGSTFEELNEYLTKYNFEYVLSNKFDKRFPNMDLKDFSEFDALFVNKSVM